MLFNAMRDKVLTQRDPSHGWVFSKWRRLFYDEASNLCYTGYKKREWNAATNKYEEVGFSTLQETPVIFRSDNVAMLNYADISADYFMLRSLTINGAINRGPDFRSRYMYTHDLQHAYEVLPFMEFSMKTGKPIKARLLKDVEVDRARLVVVKGAISRMRAATQAIIRCDENKIKHSDFYEGAEIREQHDENANKLTDIIQSFIDHDELDVYWSKVTLRLMSAYHSGNNGKPIKKFDSMMRFHDAAIFRQLGVTR